VGKEKGQKGKCVKVNKKVGKELMTTPLVG